MESKRHLIFLHPFEKYMQNERSLNETVKSILSHTAIWNEDLTWIKGLMEGVTGNMEAT